MLRWISFLSLLAATTLAQDAPAPLAKEEIAAAVAEESFSLPMPGELFAALGKQGKPDWNKLLRKPPVAAFTSRQQIALNLGALIADGYLAVEAQDAQQVKNISRDIKQLAKGLGVGQELVNRGSTIIEFADEGKWDELKYQMEATQNEVVAVMKEHHDQPYVTLVMLGGWLRGTEVVASFLAAHYTPDGAKVLRQPAVVNHFVQKLAKMDKEIIDTPVIKDVRLNLFELRKAVTFGADAPPTVDDVKKLSELAAATMKRISTKDK